jgi:hypothetical protein
MKGFQRNTVLSFEASEGRGIIESCHPATTHAGLIFDHLNRAQPRSPASGWPVRVPRYLDSNFILNSEMNRRYEEHREAVQRREEEVKRKEAAARHSAEEAHRREEGARRKNEVATRRMREAEKREQQVRAWEARSRKEVELAQKVAEAVRARPLTVSQSQSAAIPLLTRVFPKPRTPASAMTAPNREAKVLRA